MGALIAFLAAGVTAAAQTSDEPLVPDRPGLYCGSLTVGKGVVHLEAGFAFETTEASGVIDRAITTPVVFRLGFTDSLEFRAVTPGFSRAERRFGGASLTENGFGSATLGVKWRFADAPEEGPRPSMAFLFNLGLPVGSDFARREKVEPGFVWAADFRLPSDFGLSTNLGVAARFDALERERFAEFFWAAALGRAVAPATALFIEVAGTGAPERGSPVVVDGGVTHLLNNDVQLDFSVTKGIGDDAADWAVGGGVSLRFR